MFVKFSLVGIIVTLCVAGAQLSVRAETLELNAKAKNRFAIGHRYKTPVSQGSDKWTRQVANEEAEKVAAKYRSRRPTVRYRYRGITSSKLRKELSKVDVRLAVQRAEYRREIRSDRYRLRTLEGQMKQMRIDLRGVQSTVLHGPRGNPLVCITETTRQKQALPTVFTTVQGGASPSWGRPGASR